MFAVYLWSFSDVKHHYLPESCLAIEISVSSISCIDGRSSGCAAHKPNQHRTARGRRGANLMRPTTQHELVQLVGTVGLAHQCAAWQVTTSYARTNERTNELLVRLRAGRVAGLLSQRRSQPSSTTSRRTCAENRVGRVRHSAANARCGVRSGGV